MLGVLCDSARFAKLAASSVQSSLIYAISRRAWLLHNHCDSCGVNVLYNTGWDVMAFEAPTNQPDVNQVIGFAEIEIANAVFFRNVGNYFDYFGGVTVMGYSWGGGLGHDLIERLSQNEGITTLYGVYLDAIVYRGVAAHDDYPNETACLLNMYETNTFLPRGSVIDPNTITPGATVEDVDTTTAPGYPGNLTHYTIDDDPQVQQHILSTLDGLMLR